MRHTQAESIVWVSACEKLLSLWPTGVILAAVVAVIWEDVSVPRVLPYGAIFGFTIITLLYALQHRNVLARLWALSAVTLAFLALLFRGLPIRALDLVRWLPLFISVSLLAAVHAAPIIVRFIGDPRPASPPSLVSSFLRSQSLPICDLESQRLLDNGADDLDLGLDGSPNLGPNGNPNPGPEGDLEHGGPDVPDDESQSTALGSEGALTSSSIRLLLDTIDNGTTGQYGPSRSTAHAVCCSERPALPHPWQSQNDHGYMRIPHNGVLPEEGTRPISVAPEVEVNSGEPPDTASQIGLLGQNNPRL